jgi:hypothetical protein
MRGKTVCFSAVLLVASSTRVLAAEGSVQEIKSYVEGVYALQEWHAGEEVLRPPPSMGASSSTRVSL